MIKEQLEVDNTNPDLYVFKAQLNILFGNVSCVISMYSPFILLSLHHYRPLKVIIMCAVHLS